MRHVKIIISKFIIFTVVTKCLNHHLQHIPQQYTEKCIFCAAAPSLRHSHLSTTLPPVTLINGKPSTAEGDDTLLSPWMDTKNDGPAMTLPNI